MLKIPQNIKKILSVLESAGYEAYVVGGAVRDSMLGKTPDDYDVTTSCPPDKITELFDKTIPTGIKHGTVTVIIDKIPTEVTTYRIDGTYSDNRSPDSVTFTRNLKDDLSRRDFTVNAMAYNEKTGVVDLFDGKNDLKNGMIKTVGEANTRFQEDALRILRALRFASQLNFSIEDATYEAAKRLSGNLANISGERIFTELSKTLLGYSPEVLEEFINAGGFKNMNISRAIDFKIIKALPKKTSLRLFTFIKLTNANYAELSAELKFSNNLRHQIEGLMQLYKYSNNLSRTNLKRMLNLTEPEAVYDYLTVLTVLDGIPTEKAIEELDEIINTNEPYKISMLKISGEEIIKLGFSGEKIGEILSGLLNRCIEHPQLNENTELIKIIKNEYM